MNILQLILAAGLIGITAGSCVHHSQTTANVGGDNEKIGYQVGKVVRISEEYANINTDVTAPQLKSWGIADKEWFAVKFKEHAIRALLGTGYGDVAKGEWVALIEEDGKLQLAISYGNAATEIGCVVGDSLYLKALDEE